MKENNKIKAISIDKNGSVLIDTEQGFNVWVDVWEEEGELISDWNKYIFHLNCEEDIKIKNFQENTENFIEATEKALEFYKYNKNK